MIVKSVTKKPRGGAWWFVAGLILVGAATYTIYAFWWSSTANTPANSNSSIENNKYDKIDTSSNEGNKQNEIRETEIPSTKILSVPFTPQAPTANWDELHNEACEEASAIMANAYFSGMTKQTLNPDYVENEISRLTS